MVGLAALVVRCGCEPGRLVESFGKMDVRNRRGGGNNPDNDRDNDRGNDQAGGGGGDGGDVVIAIPKAPALGLLLERPVFSTYNEHTAAKFGREELSFERYEGAIRDFKEKEIYERIFREEDVGNKYVFFLLFVSNNLTIALAVLFCPLRCIRVYRLTC